MYGANSSSKVPRENETQQNKNEVLKTLTSSFCSVLFSSAILCCSCLIVCNAMVHLREAPLDRLGYVLPGFKLDTHKAKQLTRFLSPSCCSSSLLSFWIWSRSSPVILTFSSSSHTSGRWSCSVRVSTSTSKYAIWATHDTVHFNKDLNVYHECNYWFPPATHSAQSANQILLPWPLHTPLSLFELWFPWSRDSTSWEPLVDTWVSRVEWKCERLLTRAWKLSRCCVWVSSFSLRLVSCDSFSCSSCFCWARCWSSSSCSCSTDDCRDCTSAQKNKKQLLGKTFHILCQFCQKELNFFYFTMLSTLSNMYCDTFIKRFSLYFLSILFQVKNQWQLLNT